MVWVLVQMLMQGFFIFAYLVFSNVHWQNAVKAEELVGELISERAIFFCFWQNIPQAD